MGEGYIYIGGGVPCPKCGADSSVNDTYWSRAKDQLQRRRICKECKNAFRTAEVVIQEHIIRRGPRVKS